MDANRDRPPIPAQRVDLDIVRALDLGDPVGHRQAALPADVAAAGADDARVEQHQPPPRHGDNGNAKRHANLRG
ncbi:MAG: hypothetical protein U0838_09895 [Chloroflexota bacterium]